MDSNLPASSPSSSSAPSIPPTPVQEPVSPPMHQMKKGPVILIFAGLFIFVLCLLFLGLKHQMKSKIGSTSTHGGAPTAFPTPDTGSAAGAPLGFIYGSWFTNESRIFSVDPITQKSTVLASLPFSVKQVQPISSNQLIYINHTDANDQGSDISLFNTTTHVSKPVVTADPGYLIDDYRLSPNGHYLVDWELQLSPKKIVAGGKARIYTIDLSHPGTKNLLYDETASGNTIHYPVVITDIKEVYLDTYLPNSGLGYGYGMTMTNFTGSQKVDLGDVRNGTYATQPLATVNGKYLLFTGYDGSKGDGTQVQNNSRIALQNPTSVDAYDTTLKKRITLPHLPSGKLFYNIVPSKSDPNTFYFQIALSDGTYENAAYEYSLKTQTLMRIPMPNTKDPILVSTLSPHVLLFGTITTDRSIAGNLGFEYSVPYTKLSLFDMHANTVTPLALGQVTLAQYIATMPRVANVLAAESGPTPTPPSSQTVNNFPFATLTPVVPTATPVPPPPPVTKPNLVQNRTEQQSTPPGAVPDVPHERDRIELNDPIYLYGSVGTRLTVSLGDPKDLTGQYQITLSNTNKMHIGSFDYDSIVYDNMSLTGIHAPGYGIVVAQSDLSNAVAKYAEKLGLNTKETADVLIYAKEHLKAPYTFVSYFDQKTSEQLFPVSISPNPDYLRTVVFYFRDESTSMSVLPRAAVFPATKNRIGISAIVVGEVHE